MFFLPLIGSNQTVNLIWVKFSIWRASIALDWLSLYSNSYFVFICLQCMYDINLFTFHIITLFIQLSVKNAGVQSIHCICMLPGILRLLSTCYNSTLCETCMLHLTKVFNDLMMKMR